MAANDILEQAPQWQTYRPRFNHVAMSLPAELLDDEHRRALVDFYGKVFGFVEYEMLTEDRRRLVFGAYSTEQFMFLIADEPHMTCARLDHFGMSVGSKAEFDHLHDRARAYAELDERVEIIEPQVEDHGMLLLHNFYVRFVLPMMVEVQFYDYSPSQNERA